MIDLGVSAQDVIKPTMAVSISGQIEKEISISGTSSNNQAAVKIDDLTISNHLGITKALPED